MSFVTVASLKPFVLTYFRATKSGAGMTAAGVARYRRENPGSKLKTAVTGKVKAGSKASKRRKSYCARSLGQLKRASAKTRNDPADIIPQGQRQFNNSRVEEYTVLDPRPDDDIFNEEDVDRVRHDFWPQGEEAIIYAKCRHCNGWHSSKFTYCPEHPPFKFIYGFLMRDASGGLYIDAHNQEI